MFPTTKRTYRLIWLYLALALFLSVQTSCSTLGYENVDTTRKGILVANAELRAANFLLQDLIQRRAISSFDAEDAHEKLQEAHDLLQTSLAAVDAGVDPLLMEDNLSRAKAVIGIVLALLAPLADNLET